MSSTRKFDAAGNFRPLFKDDAFWGPYAANPVLQDFFPFGLYGGNAGWTRLRPETSGFVRWEDLRHHCEFLLDLLREHYLNSLWDKSLSRGSYAPVEMVWTGTLLSVLGRSVWLESGLGE